MSKIYCMMGKSSSGKDTLLKAVRKELPCLRTVTPYTTRPIRDGERDGEEYFFVSEEILSTYERQGRVIEQRAYDTVHGIWRYRPCMCGLSDDRYSGVIPEDAGVLWERVCGAALYRG